MPTVDLIKRFSGKPALVTGVLILVALAVLVWVRPSGNELTPPETPERGESVPQSADTGGIKEPASLHPAPEPITVPDARRRPSKAASTAGPGEHGVPRATEVIEVSGQVDSWQDWNSSFSDTVTRTYSAIFDYARLDTLPGGTLGFSASGGSHQFERVQRVFCRIDSVQELVKYTFPGQSVKFNIGVAFESSVAFRGNLHPGENTTVLERFMPADESAADAVEIVRNQFIVVLNSPTGYAYSLRTGIECAPGDGGDGMTVYYTHPVVVEFRRMVRYESLLSAAGETIFLLTGNPRAVTDVSDALPGSFINVVFVPRTDPHEADDLRNEKRANVHLHVSAPRILDESFLILNDTEALVEESMLDPDFKHIALLGTKRIPIDRVGHPRVTHLVMNRSAVARLKLTYQKLRQLTP